MELSCGSGSIMENPMCVCGFSAKVFKSKTKKNPNRRFYGCPLYKIGGRQHCQFFKWLDDEQEDDVGRRAEICQIEQLQRSQIEQLQRTITEFRHDLDKLDGEVRVNRNSETELRLKVDDLENGVCRQRILITGLSALVVLYFLAIIFG